MSKYLKNMFLSDSAKILYYDESKNCKIIEQISNGFNELKKNY